jgi:hypothetical protein
MARGFIILFSVFVSMGMQAQPLSLDRLRSQLDRFENGLPACFSEKCQNRKRESLDQIFLLQSKLSLPLSDLVPNTNSALRAAHFLVSYPYAQPEWKFPENLSDWLVWWERRHSQEVKLKNEWVNFSAEVFRQYYGLHRFLQLLDRGADLDLVNQVWMRDAGRIAFLKREGSRISELAFQMPDGAEGDALLAQALAYRDERLQLERAFQGTFDSVLERIFAPYTIEEIYSLLDVLYRWTSHLEKSDFLSQKNLISLTKNRDIMRKVHQASADWNDLEFGVIGVKNFYSYANPEWQLDLEAPIQEFLDTFEEAARMGVDLGLYTLWFRVAHLASLNIWIQMGVPAGVQLAEVEWDVSLTELFWAPSKPRGKIYDGLRQQASQQMQSRLRDVHRARDLLKARINELEKTNIQKEKTHENDS